MEEICLGICLSLTCFNLFLDPVFLKDISLRVNR